MGGGDGGGGRVEGIGGSAGHNEYNNPEAAADSATDISRNATDTTILNNVLDNLPLFLSSKYMLVVMA